MSISYLVNVTELIVCSELCLLTRVTSTLLFSYVLYHLFSICYQGLFNYSKVERVLTPLVFIAFAIFVLLVAVISRFALYYSRAYNSNC